MHVFIGLHSWVERLLISMGMDGFSMFVPDSEFQRSKNTNLFNIKLTALRDDGKTWGEGNGSHPSLVSNTM